MTAASLRVPHAPPGPSPSSWSQLVAPPAAFVGSDIVNGATYYNGKTYIGYVDGDGNGRVASYNHTTHAVVTSPVIQSGLTSDVHCSPSVIVRQSDHKIVFAVAPHSTAHMYVAISTNAEDVSVWGAASDIQATLGGTAYTYANLVQLSGESGKIYLFYRDFQAGTTNALCYSTSTDGGSTWSAQTALYKNAGKQSYWVVDSDGVSRIDFVVSDGAASAGDTASAYHFYYSGGSRFKSDGTTIATALPLSPSDPTKIFDGATNGSVRVPYGLAGNSGSPVVVWAAYDVAGSGQPEKYWYGTSSGGTWTVNQVDTSGSTPESNFSEGGVAIDRVSTSRLYVSKKTSGNWQVFLYTTNNGGSSWSTTQLSSDASELNLRPITPKNANSGLRAIWCFGTHFVQGTLETFGCQLRGYPNPIGPF